MTDDNALKSQAKRLDVSWEIIEHEYRKGEKSIRAIGREHNISDAAIRQKAEKLGWERENQEEIFPNHTPIEPEPEVDIGDGFTMRQRRFKAEYLIDGNGTQAAIRAGYAESGAAVEASRLLKNPKMKAAIEAEASEQMKRTLVTADKVIAELAKIGFGDMGDYITINPETGGVHLDFSTIEPDDGATGLIQEITQEEWVEGRGDDAERVRKTKFKLYSKLEALDKLARHLSLYTDAVVKHEHDHQHEHHIIPASEVRDEIEEWFRAPALLPPPLTPTEH